MMTQRGLLTALMVGGLMATLSCFRTEQRTGTVLVPMMSDARSVRIVTNAALDEIVGKYDGIPHAYEVDVARKVILYHEGQGLLSREYQQRIVARMAEVGFQARVESVRLNPPALVPTETGPVQIWPDRFTAVISVPDLTCNTDANILVNAIAFARIGHDDPRVAADPAANQLTLSFDGRRLALRNIEHAIACAGYDANGTPARLGAADAIPHGWTPIAL